ncbi:hypothetical protein IG631_08314 [Alternaria alternata]|nr:hypothetical protein IG631_08314 [Alternaria alternata]
MEALDCDNMLQDTQQSLHSTEMAYSMTANEKWEHVERRQQPTMRQVVYTFLDNLKVSRSSNNPPEPCGRFNIS